MKSQQFLVPAGYVVFRNTENTATMDLSEVNAGPKQWTCQPCQKPYANHKWSHSYCVLYDFIPIGMAIRMHANT